MKTLTLFLAIVFGLFTFLQGSAQAADPAKTAQKAGPDRSGRGMMWNNLEPQKQIELHEKMAEIHKQAAECLKSGKPAQECHTQMMNNCPLKDEKNGCPAMGRMWNHRQGMMHGVGGQ